MLQLDNGRIEAVFQLTPAGAFQLQSLTDLSSKDTWTAPESAPSSPLRLLVGSRRYDAQTRFRLLSQGVQRIPGPGSRQSIVLEDLEGEGQVRIELEMWMKFGLHFAFAEATPDSPVLREHPDWTSSETYGYHGGVSLCLSNRPTKEWIIEQAIRMIDDYGVDWILQDGENMVKECAKYRVSQIHSRIPGRA